MIIGAGAVVALAVVGLVLYGLLGGGPTYENDDYVPPPPGNVKPFPNLLVKDVDRTLTDNPLYAGTVPVPVRCEISNPDLDLRTDSDAEIKAYIDEQLACNMRVWDPAFAGTGWELVRPEVFVYRESISGPCGSFGPNGVYCSANQAIYFSPNLINAPGFELLAEPHVLDETIAHEFGHAIQARSLILFAEAHKARQSDKAEALELSRRTETQADCFDGLVLRSVSQSLGYTDQDWANIRAVVEGGGDSPRHYENGRPGGDHGLAESRLYWQTLGTSTDQVGACNTFTAPAEYVR